MKLEKLFDIDGDIKGYKLGKFYLMKHYTWGNNYEWIINTTGKNSYFQTEFTRAYEKGEIVLVNNFKQGKQLLLEFNKN